MVSDLADQGWRVSGSRRSTSHWLQRRGHTAIRELRVGCRAFDALQGDESVGGLAVITGRPDAVRDPRNPDVITLWRVDDGEL